MLRKKPNHNVSGESSDWQNYKRLLTYTRPVMGWFIVSIIGYAIFGAANAMYADILRKIIDYIASSESTDSLLPQPDFLDDRLFIAVMIVLIATVRGVANVAGLFGISRVAHTVVFQMRNQLHKHYLNMPTSDFDRFSAGSLTAKVSFTVDQIANSVSDGLVVLVRESMICMFLVAVMLYYSWQLTLLFFVIVPIMAVVFAVAARSFRKLQYSIQSGMEGLTHLVAEVVTGHVIVKTFEAKKFETKRFLRANEAFLRDNIKSELVNATSIPTTQVLLAFVNAFVIWVALDKAFIAGMSPGSAVAFFVASGLLAPSVRKLSNVNQLMQKGLVASHDIFKLLDRKTENNVGQVSLWRPEGSIRFDAVNFSYNSQQTSKQKSALRDVSFTVKPGQTVALLGKSGSGKSTLVKLLMRLYDCQSGNVYVDGVALNQLTLSSLRRNISLVSQPAILFNDTIAYNTTYGQTDDLQNATVRQQVQQALEQANAWDFVQQLDAGMDTMVGEKGHTVVWWTSSAHCHCASTVQKITYFNFGRSHFCIG